MVTHVGAVIPNGAVVVALDEPQLVRCVGADLRRFAVVADERFEFAAEVMALNPVHHVTAEGSSGCDGSVSVDVRHVVAEVLEDFDEIGIWGAAPVVLDLVGYVSWNTNKVAFVSTTERLWLTLRGEVV
jgi:hypothetical protein